MGIKVKVCRDFTSPVYGDVAVGDVIEITERHAEAWLGIGLVEKVGGTPRKVEAEEAPTQPEAKLSSASQAGQASLKQTVTKFISGSKAGRGRR